MVNQERYTLSLDMDPATKKADGKKRYGSIAAILPVSRMSNQLAKLLALSLAGFLIRSYLRLVEDRQLSSIREMVGIFTVY